MRHSGTRGLYAHWHELFVSNGWRIPERRAIEPASLHEWLSDVFVLETDDHGELRYRLAGSRVCALFGSELAGTGFSTGDDPAAFALRRRAARLGTDRSVLVASETLHAAHGGSVEAETLLLPLLHEGAPNRRVLGARVVLARAEWIGLVPVASVAVEGLRLVRPAEDRALMNDRPVPLAAPAPHSGMRKVGHLAVLDGGKRPLVTQT